LKRSLEVLKACHNQIPDNQLDLIATFIS